MPIPWNDEPLEAAARIRSNLVRLVDEFIEAAPSRLRPSVSLAQAWHRRIFEGVPLPVDYYAGEVRDTDERFPELIGYEVTVGWNEGVDASGVPEALDRFEDQMQQAVEILDAQVPVGDVPRDSGVLGSVVTVCSISHGEWVRIHPFANGNGRTARLWANWCALRYGLPPFVRLRPRPEGARYARAAAESMAGNHAATISLFADWLQPPS